MLLREGVVGERLADGGLDEFGRLGQPHGAQLGDDVLGLASGRLAALLGVDRLQHESHLAQLRRRYMAEDVAVEMHRAVLPAGLGIELSRALHQALAGIGDDKLDARQPAGLEVLQEAAPARLVLLSALHDAQDLPVTLRVDRDRHQQRDIAHLSGPAALQDDPVQINIGMSALDRPVPPGLDLPVDLLVEVGYRCRAHSRAPQRLGDVLHPPQRDPARYISIKASSTELSRRR